MKTGFLTSVIAALFAAVLLFSGTAFAAHPLITDDTGTQGKGKFQLEINGEYAHEDEDGVKSNTSEIAAAVSYGLIDSIDLVLGMPYQSIRVKEAGVSVTEDGISDMSLEVKWRFYEKDGLSFGLKPGISFPTGDDERGLGAGKTAYSIFFITSKEAEPWAFHMNLGYMRNENKAEERENLWHASAAGAVKVIKDLTLVANVGIEKNTDRTVETNPAFILGGLIYSIGENFDIDFGVKGGLNEPETDYSVLAGIAIRF